jgi:hypothetical protein
VPNEFQHPQNQINVSLVFVFGGEGAQHDKLVAFVAARVLDFLGTQVRRYADDLAPRQIGEVPSFKNIILMRLMPRRPDRSRRPARDQMAIPIAR